VNATNSILISNNRRRLSHMCKYKIAITNSWCEVLMWKL